MNVFNTPGKLTVQICKLYYDPKWMNSSTTENLQLFIKSNIMCLFVNISAHQTVLDNVKEDRLCWTKPGGGDRISLFIGICNKNAHGTRGSASVAKTQLPSKIKCFQHNTLGANRMFYSRKKEQHSEVKRALTCSSNSSKSASLVLFPDFKNPSEKCG